MPNFRKARDLVAAMKRDIADRKSDVMLALGAEASKKLAEETAGDVNVIPIVTDKKIMVIHLEKDANKVESRKQTFENVKDHIAENMETILRSRNVI